MPRRKTQENSHPDLFSNNADIIINDLLAAFRTQNLYETERLIQHLAKEYPTHSQLPSLQKLLATQQKLKQPVEDISQELKEMRETICPLALKWLGLGAAGYIKPLWQRLALALQGQRFNPKTPELHCSFVYHEASDWVSVREAVENEPDWHQCPTLILRLAKSLYFLNELDYALEIWFYLFWQFPTDAQVAIDEPKNPTALRKRWQVFDELAEEMNPISFPTWMLLTDSKLIHYSFNRNLHTLTAHSQNYQTVQRLLLVKKDHTTNTQHTELDLRKALKHIDENLLKWYLKCQNK